MTKQKTTKRALLMSALSLLLCVSMLVGSTFAWFTDSVTSGNNIIKSGNLDVELEYKKVDNGVVSTEWATVKDKTDIFNPKALWEPGHVEVVYLKVSNLGTLALKYQLGVNFKDTAIGKTEDGKDIKLSDHLVFKVVEMPDALTTYTDREAVKLAAGTEKGLTDYNGKTTALDAKGGANAEDYVALIVYMPETVGNEANYRGTDVPTIELGINLYATQYTAEEDSFGSDYDKFAGLPWDGESKEDPKADANGVIHVTNAAELVAMMDTTGNSIYSGKTIVLDADINLGGKTVKGIGGDTNFAGIFDGQGHTISNFKIDATHRSYYAGLFGQVSHGGTVKNLTVKGATVMGNSMVGAVASSVDSGSMIDNCKAIDCTVIGVKKVGSVVGYSAGSTVTNNYAENCTIYYGEKEADEVLGFVNTGSTVSNNTAQNVTIKKRPMNSEQLAKAIDAGDTEIELAPGEYTVNMYDISNRNTLTITGSGADTKLAFSNLQVRPSQFNTLTIENCTIERMPNKAWGHLVFGSSNNATGVYTLRNCTFNGVGSQGIYINENTSGATYNIENCTFNGDFGKEGAITIQNNADVAVNVNVSGCTFNNIPETSNKIFVHYENKGLNLTVDGKVTVAKAAMLTDAVSKGATEIYLTDSASFRMPSNNTSKAVKIVGNDTAVIDMTWGAYWESANLTFENVTFKTTFGKANGNGSDYAALYSKNVKYNNCTFNGGMLIGRDGAAFNGCTFNIDSDYLRTYGNDATFEGCTFNTVGKAILIYSDGGSEVSKVSVKNSKFNASVGAKASAIANQNCAAIEIHNYGNGVNLTTEGNTYDSNFSGEWRIKVYETGRTQVIVNGTEYTTIAIDGKTMTIDANKNVTVNP